MMRIAIRRILILVVCFLVAAPLFAQQHNPHASAPLKIGYSLESLKIERWQTDVAEFQKRAHELGATVLVETADGDENLQYQQSEKLLRSGIQVLVVVAHNTDTASRIVEAAKAKHVPVLCYDRLIRNTKDVDLFVGFDSFSIGAQQASSLVQRAPKGNYVLIEGSPTDLNAKLTHDGQMSVLTPLIQRGDIKIIADNWSTDWSPTEAYMHMTSAITSNGNNIAAVVAANDGTAGGAIQALQEHNLAGKVLVSGQDADLVSIVRILEDSQTMTVYKPISLAAHRAAEAAVALARGEKFDTHRTISNGTADVQAILLNSVVVTKDNVKQTVIQDGFQKAAMIKQGLPKDKWSLIE